MDEKKILKNIVIGSLFFGNCLSCAQTQAANDEVTKDFLSLVSGESPRNAEWLMHEITELGKPNHPLYWAIRFGNIPIIESLLPGIDLNRVIPPSRAQHENEGETPLEQAIGDLEIVELLLNNGANPNLKRIDEYGNEITPLGKAVEAGAVSVVKLLLKQGANPHWKDLRNRTLLHMAMSFPFIPRDAIQMVKLFWDLGLDPNGKDDAGQVPLIELMRTILIDTDIRHYRICELDELEHEELSQKQIQDRQQSIESISQDLSCYCQILKLFVDRGADINAQNNKGNTLLHRAIPFTWHDKEIPTQIYILNTHPNLELFQTLIELGADINLPNNAEKTPLDLLLQRKEELCHNDKKLQDEYDEAIAFLREHGATEGQPREKSEAEDESEDEEKSEEIAAEDKAKDKDEIKGDEN
ncbi:MAG: ankyrin repeat domain-containing protein [Puniceicoccales bacterium]|jgi:ankyrin repeat protein|nr:ankyrin repeat domain-containing protein [Puniceicoccales bacterium]